MAIKPILDSSTILVGLTDITDQSTATPVAVDASGNLKVGTSITATLGAISMPDGSDVCEGAKADAIVAAGATGSISAKLRRVTQGIEDLKTLIVLAAGSAIIGKVGIDQTTPGTTNLVSASQSGTWNVTTTGGALDATLSTLSGKVTACNTGAVTVASSALPTGAASSANQTSLAAQIGEVQASPTANTVLDRLKALATALSGVIKISSSGTITTATISRVSGSAVSGTLLAANSNRRRIMIVNEQTGAAKLYIKFGATASLTSYTLCLAARETYESPTDWIYQGVIDGIWDSAAGAAQITEMV